MEKKQRKRKLNHDQRKDLGFQLILLAWPVIQFCIFYIFVNLNSFKLAFNFEDTSNFFLYFKQCFNEEYLKAAGISIILFLFSHAISIPAALIFSYYISKKFFGHKFFKLILFLPSIISATVMIAIFKTLVDTDLPRFLYQNQIVESFNFLNINDSEMIVKNYIAVVLFSIFIGLGTTTLVYSNKMSEISKEILEAAELDGVNQFQEFIHIILPATFPVISTFIVTGVATIFTNQFNLFTLFGSSISTLKPGPMGYLIYNQVQSVTISGSGGDLVYSQMAALGLLSTAFIIPLVFGVKYLLERFGPSEK